MQRVNYPKIMLSLTLLILLFSMDIGYGDEPVFTIKKTDRCPVCGMFVYKYPKWVAQILFKDGSYYFYDGAKDMFKHIFDIAKYTPGISAENIKDIYVTDYYGVELIDAKSAFYVIGSDVLGPMGNELLPFKDQKSAQEFLEDHKGKAILRFQDVTPAHRITGSPDMSTIRYLKLLHWPCWSQRRSADAISKWDSGWRYCP